MNIKFTKPFLSRLEDIFAESDYILRYEKGNFKSGYCILKDTKIVIVNKYFTLEGKINALLEIIKNVEMSTDSLTDKNKKLLQDLLKV